MSQGTAPDSLTIYEGQERYQKRVAELERGLSWYKRLYERERLPEVASIPKDSAAGRTGSGEEIYYIDKTADKLEIYTEKNDAYSVYRFGKLPSRWELLAMPEGGFRLVERRLFFAYDGASVGLAYVAREGASFYQLSVDVGCTFFDRVALRAELAYPVEVRARLAWKFN